MIHTRDGTREEEEVPHADGLHTYVSLKFPLLDEKGEVMGIAGVSTDVTSLKRSEAEKADLRIQNETARETSRLKSEFIANMSHEIRTPINGVIGTSDLLLESRLDPEQLKYAKAVRTSAEGLLTIINDILDFSKIEAGKLDVESVVFSPSQILSDVEQTLGFSIRQKKLAIKEKNSSSVPHSIFGDPGRIRQVLINLVGNALKFTAEGEIEISVTTEKDHLCYSVRDTGIGMTRDEISRLFEPFAQADQSVTKRFGGTGLGLSISRRLVELMGGKIGVSSEFGKGATFWFTLPCVEASPTPEKRHLLSVENLEPPSSVAKRILLVEDNVVNQVITVKMLQKLGHIVEVATNGLEALTALARAEFDLVIMDCQMPEMDGYTATREIRKREARGIYRWSHVPIVALTANAMKEDEAKCLLSGMDAYLTKPIQRDALQWTVEKWTKRTPESTSKG
ncbi:MAG: response regulator [Cryobacterium sp.]|nr:response regulator [Oligoflexia bacterium]